MFFKKKLISKHIKNLLSDLVFNIVKFVIILSIHFYKKTFTKIFRSNCRFNPTCSQYAIEALLKHGLIKGTNLSIKRIRKCVPGSSTGNDFVPD